MVLAVGALAWGATHGSSKGGGLGSAKDQAAARTSLAALTLPSGFARDPSFTACGNIADACLTAHGDTAQTLASLTTIVHSAGGTLPDNCSASITCDVRYRWPEVHLWRPRQAARCVGVLPARRWVVATRDPDAENCRARDGRHRRRHRRSRPLTIRKAGFRGGRGVLGADRRGPARRSRAPVDLPRLSQRRASSAPAASTPSPPAAANSTPVLVTTPPLPACAATALTDNVSVHLALADAAAQLVGPCAWPRLPPRRASVHSRARRRQVVWFGASASAAGVQQLFVATLTDDGRGNTVGTLAVTTQSAEELSEPSSFSCAMQATRVDGRAAPGIRHESCPPSQGRCRR